MTTLHLEAKGDHCLLEILQLDPRIASQQQNSISSNIKKNKKLPFAIGETKEGCNVFNGKWVWDEKRPLYEESECPYIQPQLTCQEHGRPDKNYQHWRWQPHDCSLPSFNATLMLETLRGKRMLFVGDSLNRGQYVSMVCLVHRLIPENAKSMKTIGNFDVFTIKDYNATIEFYWAPFLLESNSDDAVKHRIEERVVRKGSINAHGKYWKGANIIVFNTYLWWMRGPHFNILQGSFDDEVKDIVEVSTEEAYGMAIKSMLRWIKRNMYSNKTRVFFTSMSPSHEQSIEWGGEPNKNCYNETKMIEDPNYWGSDSRKSIMQVIKQEFGKSKVPITFLNITQLSKKSKEKLPFAIGETKEGCNVFNGKWIWDEKRPLYEESECPYIQPQLTCQEHGRPDKDYQHWRWQPHNCSLPSFNATLMLETLRGKKMLFVGDSLNRGQYVSMVCLVHRIIPENAKSMNTVGSFDVFNIKDYNATIEFYWAPFLLESNSDNPGKHRIEERVVRKDSINTHGKYWKGADIIVFNTYLWWRSGFNFNILQGSFDDEVKDIVEVSTEEAYRMAMKSLLRWIKKNMDPKRTRVFFTSMSPSHERSIDWGGEPNKNCYNETKMIEDPNYWGSDSRKSIMQVISQEFGKSKMPISFLNITQLSKKNKDYKLPPFAIGEGEKDCNLFNGKWIWDESNRPLYNESECPYLLPQVTCQEHGRPDKDYLYWRWQPNDCLIPRFNASLMLENLRGKRMMFVGDSLNRGQFTSMVCLLHKIVPNDAKSLDKVDSFTIFTAKDYNATIEFYWAPFLLESNADSPGKHRVPDRIVRKNSIDTHGKYWKGVDILVFNTYIWWMSGRTFKILNGTFDDDNIKDIEDVPTNDAYRMGMKNLLRWINKNMDPKRNRVFFTSMSPSHAWSKEWRGDPNGNCYNETKMIEDPNYWGSDSRKSIMQVIKEEFSKSKVPITFLNITQLSMPRRDAHTSIYKERWGPLSPQEKANPSSYADCIHWCLPGLQDVWNELLYAKLLYP
ncbi:hypothetical protein MTR67_024611 [Solanum verrucosum]|uniref:Trichome birefringence-like N-terminal domain-containing protein n=2 Tax=Solanum TaxID=4107 RepID=A0AAF0R3D3_SOLVR|nr:hypothetical protein MTR67_024611 [Solanum verrucosum]